VKLLAGAINSELVQSWRAAAEAAGEAAKKSREANDTTPKPKNAQGGNPIENYFQDVKDVGSSKIVDDTANTVLAGLPGGELIKGLLKGTGNTFQGREKNSLKQSKDDFVAAQDDLLLNAGNRLTKLKDSGGGEFKQVDDQLVTAESERRKLKVRADRDFTQKGLAIPVELQEQILDSNKVVGDLTEKRGNLQKPFTEDLNAVTKRIEATQKQIQGLDDPAERNKKVKLGLDPDKEKSELEKQLKALQNFKRQSEFTLASLKVDPVLSLGAAFKELSNKLSEAARSTELFVAQQKTITAKQQVKGFDTDLDAGRKASVRNAETASTIRSWLVEGFECG
jgi:hypothetical protein